MRSVTCCLRYIVIFFSTVTIFNSFRELGFEGPNFGMRWRGEIRPKRVYSKFGRTCRYWRSRTDAIVVKIGILTLNWTSAISSRSRWSCYSAFARSWKSRAKVDWSFLWLGQYIQSIAALQSQSHWSPIVLNPRLKTVLCAEWRFVLRFGICGA